MKSGLDNLRNHGFRLMDQVNNYCDHCTTLVNNCCSRCGKNFGGSSTRPLQYPGSCSSNVLPILMDSIAENVDRSGATPFEHSTSACMSCSECFNSIQIADTSCSDCGRSVECSHVKTEQIVSGQQELDDATMDSFVVLDSTNSYIDFENSSTPTEGSLLPSGTATSLSDVLSQEMSSLTNSPSSGELNHQKLAIREVPSTAPEVTSDGTSVTNIPAITGESVVYNVDSHLFPDDVSSPVSPATQLPVGETQSSANSREIWYI